MVQLLTHGFIATTVSVCLLFQCFQINYFSPEAYVPPEPTPEAVELLVEVEEVNTSYDLASKPEQTELFVSRGMGSDVEQWRPLVAGHFNPGDVDRVLCLMGKESGGNPDARNTSSGASGLMQIMPFWAGEYGVSRADLFTPEINLYIARKIRDSQGWGAWSPYNRGECR